MESIEKKQFDKWVEWSMDAAAHMLAEFLKEQEWPFTASAEQKETYFRHLISRFRDHLQTRTRRELDEKVGSELTVTAIEIGEGYVGMYLTDMLKDMKNRKPLLLIPPRGVTTEEYQNYLRWVSHQYGRPEQYKGHNFDRVLKKIKDEYGELFPPAVWW